MLSNKKKIDNLYMPFRWQSKLLQIIKSNTMASLTFKQFCEQFKEDDTPAGDLIRDMLEDTDFPWNLNNNKARFKELKADKKIIEIYEDLVSKYHEK